MSMSHRLFYLLILSIATLFFSGLHCAESWVSILPNTYRTKKQQSHWQPCQLVMDVKYPTQIKSVVTKLTNSIQKSLKSRQSRIEIELPPAADFGVEARSSSSSNNKRMDESDVSKVRRSNREAARLITEMFAVLGPTTVVYFPTELEAQEARNLWARQFKGQVLALDAKKSKGMGSSLRSRRYSMQEREAALLADESTGVFVPDGTEVLLFAGPRSKDLRKIVQVHRKLGEDTLILLLNARLETAGADFTSAVDQQQQPQDEESIAATTSTTTATEVARIFTSVFHYAPPSRTETAAAESLQSRELLVYHEYQGDWYIAEKKAASGSGGGFLKSVASAVSGSNEFVTRWQGAQRPCSAEVVASVLKSADA